MPLYATGRPILSFRALSDLGRGARRVPRSRSGKTLDLVTKLFDTRRRATHASDLDVFASGRGHSLDEPLGKCTHNFVHNLGRFLVVKHIET